MQSRLRQLGLLFHYVAEKAAVQSSTVVVDCKHAKSCSNSDLNYVLQTTATSFGKINTNRL